MRSCPSNIRNRQRMLQEQAELSLAEMRADNEKLLASKESNFSSELSLAIRHLDSYKKQYEDTCFRLENQTRICSNLSSEINALKGELEKEAEVHEKKMKRQSFWFKVILGIATVVVTIVIR